MLLLLWGCAAPERAHPSRPTEADDTSPPDTADTADTPEYDACASYVGLATPEQVAATPRGDDGLELLALAIDGAFTASDATFDRVKADVTAARAAWAELATVSPETMTDGRSIVVYNVDDATLIALDAGTLAATACADLLYQRTDSSVYSTFAWLQFEGIYDVPALAAEYEALLGGDARAQPGQSGDDGDHLCAHVEGDTWYYRFEDAWGDCPSGCAYGHWYLVTSASSGSVMPEDDWGDTGPDGAVEPDPDPRPGWMDWEWTCA